MPTPVDIAGWTARKEEIEACLREGFHPKNGTGGRGSAVEEAGRRLFARGVIGNGGASPGSLLAKWVRQQQSRAAAGKQHWTPDWNLFRKSTQPAAPVSVKTKMVRRWLLTAAQDNTAVHAGFWTNLQAYAAYTGATVLVGAFTYNKSLFEDHATRGSYFRPPAKDFVVHEAVECGPVLFCAEMNTLPTAVDPLSDLQTYSRGRWAVFPHAKRRLITVAAQSDPPVIMTTGCCTIENYIPKKAGQKAQFHHAIGAVIVEVEQDGTAHVRHISADQHGAFQDLDAVVSGGIVRTGNRVEAISFGDIQSPFVDPDVAKATWGLDLETGEIGKSGTIVDTLRPKYGVYHDLIDFKAISHHDLKRPFEQLWAHVNGHTSVEGDIERAAKFLELTGREDMRSVAIESNHDKWLDRWLDDGRGRVEKQNMVAFYRYGLARAEAITRGDEFWSTWRYALRSSSAKLDHVEFVREGESFVILREHGGIEIGQHGHLGPNGGPAAPRALARVAARATIGDKHTPEIRDGLYVAGTSSLLRLRFNQGPSSWRHAHVVHYPNGRRAILFIINGKWRA